MTTLFAYVMTNDSGFAPNPFHGFCTLARCMPSTRSVAKVGDYVVGLAGKRLRGCLGESGDWRIIYAMQVTDKKTFREYWDDKDFLCKRPDRSAGGEKALGDNDIRLNTPGKHVLISGAGRFTYWGKKAPTVPPNLGFLVPPFIPYAIGHRRKFSKDEVEAFIRWFDGQERGRLGMPTDWDERKKC